MNAFVRPAGCGLARMTAINSEAQAIQPRDEKDRIRTSATKRSCKKPGFVFFSHFSNETLIDRKKLRAVLISSEFILLSRTSLLLYTSALTLVANPVCAKAML